MTIWFWAGMKLIKKGLLESGKYLKTWIVENLLHIQLEVEE